MINRRLAFSIYLIGLFAVLRFVAAQASPAPGAHELPPQAKPSSDVLLPVPAEVFTTLDKFSHSNWKLIQLDGLAHAKPHGDQTQLALLLGVVIGEGFIAVEAQDAGEVKEVGNAVLTLARGLGVEPIVMRRSRSIVELADKDDWSAVRKEWDKILPDVEEGMKQIQSERLSQLVSLGGWLRGTKAMTALILQHYSAKDAALLSQPVLLDRFEYQLGMMGGHGSVSQMREGLRKMRLLVVTPGQPISEKSVRDLARLSDELLAVIAGPDANR